MASNGMDFRATFRWAQQITTAGPRTGILSQTVIRKTARDITFDAKVNAPHDTGWLEESIGHSDLRTVGRSGSLEVEIGPEADYGVFVELGTSRSAAQPYLGPAADKHEPVFAEAMAQVGIEALGG